MGSPLLPRFPNRSGCHGRDLMTVHRSQSGYYFVTSSHATTPAHGGRLWRAAGDDDQQSNRSTAAAMTERWAREPGHVMLSFRPAPSG